MMNHRKTRTTVEIKVLPTHGATLQTGGWGLGDILVGNGYAEVSSYTIREYMIM